MNPEIQEKHRRLFRLLKGQSFTYHNSRERRQSAVFEVARRLSEEGKVELKQNKLADGSFDYIATGLLTENRMRKARDGKYHE